MAMRFFTSGNFYPSIPRSLQELPFNLLRSSAYPGQSGVIQEGIEQYRRGEQVAAYMPQRAAFTKWKTPPTVVGWGQNVIGMLQATRHKMEIEKLAQPHVTAARSTRVDNRGLPIMDAVRAPHQMGLNRLPQPTDNMDPNLREGYVPLARGAVPMNHVMSAEAVNQVAVDASNPEMLRNYARVQALDEVQRQRRFMYTLQAANAGQPWFLR